MEMKDYLLRMREYLHDTDGKVWGDEELNDLLKYAAVKYCRDTGSFRATAAITVDANGVMKAPSNYLEWVAGWNTNGQRIEAASVDTVSDFYGDFVSIKGVPKFVYEDTDNIGSFRFFPNPADMASSVAVGVPFPGIPVARSYGIPIAGSYGIPVRMISGASAGEMVYVKSESVERIADYVAIIYLAVSMAYGVDGDFQDSGKSQMYLGQYNRRIAHFGQIRHGVKRVSAVGRFF